MRGGKSCRGHSPTLSSYFYLPWPPTPKKEEPGNFTGSGKMIDDLDFKNKLCAGGYPDLYICAYIISVCFKWVHFILYKLYPSKVDLKKEQVQFIYIVLGRYLWYSVKIYFCMKEVSCRALSSKIKLLQLKQEKKSKNPYIYILYLSYKHKEIVENNTNYLSRRGLAGE